MGKNTVIDMDIKGAILNGRILAIVVGYTYKLLSLFNISRYQNMFVPQIIGMILYAISATVLFFLIKDFFDNSKQLILLWFGILIAFVNPYIVETYNWGAFDFAIGVLFGVIGVYLWERRRFLGAFVFSFFAMSCYENNIIIVMILILYIDYMKIYIEKESETKDYIVTIIKGGLFCLGTAVCDFLFQRIALIILDLFSEQTGKSETFKTVNIQLGIKGIKFVGRAIKGVLWKCYGALPEGVLFVALCVIMLFVFCVGVKSDKIKQSIGFVTVSAVCFLAVFAWSFLGYGHPPRITMSVFFVISMICVFLLILSKELSDKARNCIIGGLCILFVFIYYNTQICNTDMYISQAIDEYEAMMVEKLIEEHEEETGIEITTVATCGGLFGAVDMDSTYLAPQLLKQYEGDVPFYRICYYAWGLGGRYINYVTGTDYQARQMTLDEIEKYFDPNEKTLGYFKPEKQMVFDGDTLYWRIY